MARETAVKRDPVAGTIPQVAQRYGLGVKLVRAGVKSGDLPAHFPAGTAWPRVFYSDAEAWIRRARARPTAHAEARVAEVLEREAR